MYEHRTPITDENFHHEQTARILAGDLSLHDREPVTAIARDVERELTEVYRENPGITSDELLMTGRFDERQLKNYGRSAATRAAKESRRQVA